MKKQVKFLQKRLLPFLVAIIMVSTASSPSFAVTLTPLVPNLPDINIPPINLSYNYEILLGEATITGYNGTGGNITIPSTLEGYPVTTIGISAFMNKTSLTGVVIPDSVKKIDDEAFRGCTNLASVTLPGTLTTVEMKTFYDCESLTSIVLPESIKTIEAYAFGSTGITSLAFPKNLTSFQSTHLFTDYLTSFTVDPQNPAYASVNGVLYSKDLTRLIKYPTAKADVSFSIPAGVTEISAAAFQYCSNLKSVTVPSNVNSVGSVAFCFIKSLTSVVFQGSQTTLGEFCFQGSPALTNVTLPAGLKTIPKSTFRDCISLDTISLPSTLTSIEVTAFENCKALTSITIPESVTLINDSAFKGSSNLAYILFKGNAPSIGAELFSNVASGFKIYYSAAKTGWTTPTWHGYTTQAGEPSILPPQIIQDPEQILSDGTTQLKLYLGNVGYLVNGETRTMDTSPVLLNNRLLLPVRYVAEPLGAVPVWSQAEQKVTVVSGTTVIELWIGNNTAKVNGVARMIDPDNPNVKPVIVPPGRTMLPLRFLGESLGCEVIWNQSLQEATLTRTDK